MNWLELSHSDLNYRKASQQIWLISHLTKHFKYAKETWSSTDNISIDSILKLPLINWKNPKKFHKFEIIVGYAEVKPASK